MCMAFKGIFLCILHHPALLSWVGQRHMEFLRSKGEKFESLFKQTSTMQLELMLNSMGWGNAFFIQATLWPRPFFRHIPECMPGAGDTSFFDTNWDFSYGWSISVLILMQGKVMISIPIPIMIPKSNKFDNIDFNEMPKIIEWGTGF